MDSFFSKIGITSLSLLLHVGLNQKIRQWNPIL